MNHGRVTCKDDWDCIQLVIWELNIIDRVIVPRHLYPETLDTLMGPVIESPMADFYGGRSSVVIQSQLPEWSIR